MKNAIGKFALTLLLLSLIAPLSGEELVFAMGVPPENPSFLRMKKLCAELERRIDGMEISLESMTFIRSKREMLQGHIDGDVGRIKAAYKEEDGVLFLEPPIFIQNFLYFVRSDLPIYDASDLEDYRLTAVRGNAAVSSFIEQKGWPALEAPDNETAFKQIMYNRADFMIAVEQDRLILDGKAFEDYNIRSLEEPAFTSEIYIVLNGEHQNLYPRLNRALSAIADEGLLEAILLRGE